MNTPEEIRERMYASLEALDLLILPQGDEVVGMYAKRRANRDYLKKHEGVVLAEEMKKYTGSNPTKEMEAKASRTYKDFERQMSTANGLALQAEAEKDLLELNVGVLRTELSFEKEQINNTI